jgi:hypothetical protein
VQLVRPTVLGDFPLRRGHVEGVPQSRVRRFIHRDRTGVELSHLPCGAKRRPPPQCADATRVRRDRPTHRERAFGVGGRPASLCLSFMARGGGGGGRTTLSSARGGASKKPLPTPPAFRGLSREGGRPLHHPEGQRKGGNVRAFNAERLPKKKNTDSNASRPPVRIQ